MLLILELKAALKRYTISRSKKLLTNIYERNEVISEPAVNESFLKDNQIPETNQFLKDSFNCID